MSGPTGSSTVGASSSRRASSTGTCTSAMPTPCGASSPTTREPAEARLRPSVGDDRGGGVPDHAPRHRGPAPQRDDLLHRPGHAPDSPTPASRRTRTAASASSWASASPTARRRSSCPSTRPTRRSRGPTAFIDALRRPPRRSHAGLGDGVLGRHRHPELLQGLKRAGRRARRRPDAAPHVRRRRPRRRTRQSTAPRRRNTWSSSACSGQTCCWPTASG